MRGEGPERHNGAVRGEGPERHGSGSTDSGRGEILDGNGEILTLVMAGRWRNSVFAAAKFVAKSCIEIFVLVLRILCPQKNCHRPSTANFTAPLGEISWSVTSQFVRGSRKADSRKCHCKAQTGRWERQGDLEVTGSIGSAFQCHISLGNLAQERNGRRLGFS